MIDNVTKYKIVTGRNVDETHPHGDMDRIIIDGSYLSHRQDEFVLRGEDLTYLMECFCARYAICGEGMYDSVFDRRVLDEQMNGIIGGYNRMMNGSDFAYPAAPSPEGKSFHDLSSGRADIKTACPDLFWSYPSYSKYPIAQIASGDPLRKSLIDSLSYGCDYFQKCYVSCGWYYSQMTFNIQQMHLWDDGWQGKTESELRRNSTIYCYYCHGFWQSTSKNPDDHWDYGLTTCEATGSIPATIGVSSITGLQFIKRLLPVYTMSFEGLFRDETNTYKFNNSGISVVVRGSWISPPTNTTSISIPLPPTSSLISKYGMPTLRPPSASPTGKAPHWYDSRLWIKLTNLCFIAEVVEDICDS